MHRHLRRLAASALATSVAAVALSPAVAPSAHAQTREATAVFDALQAEHVEGQLVVSFDATASPADELAAYERARVARARSLPLAAAPNTQVVTAEPGQSLADALTSLRAEPGVRFAEPNYIWRINATPNDPSYGQLWGLHNTGQTGGTADADIDAPEAWDVTTGSDSVVVAVVDSGIAYDHPDLAPNLWTNTAEIPGNGIDDDANGYVDDWRGWDFAGRRYEVPTDADSDPRDFHGHGTHVAGTIGARGNNSIGVSGVAWNVKLMPLRVFDGEGRATTADVAAAFAYAGAMFRRLGVTGIVNYSGGGSQDAAVVRAAITANPNTLYIAAAGNGGVDLDGSGEVYPCELEYANVICVAASNSTDALAPFSNYSEQSVDLAAPGTSVLSTRAAYGPSLFTETSETDPFAARWTRGAWPGSVNTWATTTGGSLPTGTGAYLSDSPAGNYVNSSDTWVQTAAPISLAGQVGCRATYSTNYATEFYYDYFYLLARDNTAFSNATDAVRAYTGTGTRADSADVSAFDGGPLYLRYGMFSDAINAGDGGSVDNLTINCLTSTYSGGGNTELTSLSGTSMATPHVTGVAALALARVPTATVAQLRNALLTSGDPRPAFSAAAGITATGRRLNARAAVYAINPNDFTPPTIAIASPASGAVFAVGQAVSAAYSCTDAGASGLASCAGPVANGAPIDTSTAGTRSFSVTATDYEGNSAMLTHTYHVGSAPSDTIHPTVAITTPADGATYTQGQVVSAAFSCADTGGSNLASCTGPVASGAPIDTATVGTRSFTVTAVDGAGNTTNRTHNYIVRAAPVTYRPLTPERVLDTRRTQPLSGGHTVNVRLRGAGGVPASGVGAVVLNVTATEPSTASYLTTWPAGEPRPTASSLNWAANQTVANLVIAKLGPDGTINLWTETGTTHIIADVVGWYPTGSAYEALTPSRLLDTRQSRAIAGGTTTNLAVLNRGGVPARGVSAVVLNVTSTGSDSPSYLTTWPAGEPRPTASSLNWAANQTVANLVIAKLGPDGTINLWTETGTTHIIADVVGWYATGPTYNALTPERVLDTRRNGAVNNGQTLNLALLNKHGVPATGVGAVVLNLTSTGSIGAGYFTTWPSGELRPETSSLNWAAGQTVANLVIAKLGPDGSINVYNANDAPDRGPTHLIADVVGWLPL